MKPENRISWSPLFHKTAAIFLSIAALIELFYGQRVFWLAVVLKAVGVVAFLQSGALLYRAPSWQKREGVFRGDRNLFGVLLVAYGYLILVLLQRVPIWLVWAVAMGMLVGILCFMRLSFLLALEEMADPVGAHHGLIGAIGSLAMSSNGVLSKLVRVNYFLVIPFLAATIFIETHLVLLALFFHVRNLYQIQLLTAPPWALFLTASHERNFRESFKEVSRSVARRRLAHLIDNQQLQHWAYFKESSFRVPRTLDAEGNWQYSVSVLMHRAGVVILDATNFSEALGEELDMIERNNFYKKVIVLRSDYYAPGSLNYLRRWCAEGRIIPYMTVHQITQTLNVLSRHPLSIRRISETSIDHVVMIIEKMGYSKRSAIRFEPEFNEQQKSMERQKGQVRDKLWSEVRVLDMSFECTNCGHIYAGHQVGAVLPGDAPRCSNCGAGNSKTRARIAYPISPWLIGSCLVTTLLVVLLIGWLVFGVFL